MEELKERLAQMEQRFAGEKEFLVKQLKTKTSENAELEVELRAALAEIATLKSEVRVNQAAADELAAVQAELSTIKDAMAFRDRTDSMSRTPPNKPKV